MLRGGYLGEGVGGKKRRAMGDDERREEQKTGAAPSRFKSSQSHTANTPQTSAFETITPHLPHPIQSTVPYSKSLLTFLLCRSLDKPPSCLRGGAQIPLRIR